MFDRRAVLSSSAATQAIFWTVTLTHRSRSCCRQAVTMSHKACWLRNPRLCRDWPPADGVSFSSNEQCQCRCCIYRPQSHTRLCSEQGVHFQPMVAETTGAWDKTASHVLHIVAAAVAAREGGAVADLYSRLLQELSITTRRFRAQAALRRRAEIINQTQPIARASAALLEGWHEHLDGSTESRPFPLAFIFLLKGLDRRCSPHACAQCTLLGRVFDNEGFWP